MFDCLLLPVRPISYDVIIITTMWAHEARFIAARDKTQ